MPQAEEQTAPRVFISYSHDSAEHEDRVLALAVRLRHDGIDAQIDQYDTAPPDGWPMWMAREIQKADYVAMVCTETYLRRVENQELPGKGRGVLWEAKLIYNSLYLEDSKVQRFIPVLFAGEQSSNIPLPIRGSTYFQLDSVDGYEDFYRHIIGQPRHGKPALGKLKALPAIEPKSYPASRETRIEQALVNAVRARILFETEARLDDERFRGVATFTIFAVNRGTIPAEIINYGKAEIARTATNALPPEPNYQLADPPLVRFVVSGERHAVAEFQPGMPGTPYRLLKNVEGPLPENVAEIHLTVYGEVVYKDGMSDQIRHSRYCFEWVRESGVRGGRLRPAGPPKYYECT